MLRLFKKTARRRDESPNKPPSEPFPSQPPLRAESGVRIPESVLHGHSKPAATQALTARRDSSPKSLSSVTVGSGLLTSYSMNDLDRIGHEDMEHESKVHRVHNRSLWLTGTHRHKGKDQASVQKRHQRMKHMVTDSPDLPQYNHLDGDDGSLSSLTRSYSLQTMKAEKSSAHRFQRKSSHFGRAHQHKEFNANPLKSSPVLSTKQRHKLRKVRSYREISRVSLVEDCDGNNTLARSQSVGTLDRMTGDMRQTSLPATPSENSQQGYDSPGNITRKLHKPKSVEAFVATLSLQSERDVNTVDADTGDALIHAVVRRQVKERPELLLSLLTNSRAYVDLKNGKGMTALHIAVEEGCELCVKVLVLFGANINERGCNEFTPLDLAIDNARMPNIEGLLMELGAKSSAHLIRGRTFKFKVPHMHSYAQQDMPPTRGQRLRSNDRLNDFLVRRGASQLHSELEHHINRMMSHSSSFGSADEAIAITVQQRELVLYNKTMRMMEPKRPEPMAFGMEGGSRILFLDGGGMKGLVEIEILMQIELQTERKITDLFDWIVGTSTGGIIALGLVYAQMSLNDIRQLYLKIRNKVFAKPRMGFAYSSETLEQLLKETFGPNMVMSDVNHPKVLIAAVNKAVTPLELHFFNNCFGDDYSEQLVWKVARYTSAAPMFFTEFENYVDGGILANNPSDSGLTAIQNFYRLEGKKLPIALVVSIGTGVYPAEKLGNVDVQEFLFFGKRWFNLDKLRRRAQNLMSLLSNALVESEVVARNCRSRCEEQGIPFYRFSPNLEEVIPAGETDLDKLLDMVMQARTQTQDQGLRELIDLFTMIAEASRQLSPFTRAQQEGEKAAAEYTEVDGQ